MNLYVHEVISMNNRRIVITGMGMISALGENLKTNWRHLTSGISGVKPIELFDAKELETRFAAQVSEKFEKIAEEEIPKRDRKQMTRLTRMLIVAANEAVRDSGIDFNAYDKTKIAVILGVIAPAYNKEEKEKSTAHAVVKSMANAPSAWVSIYNGLEGPSMSVATACASSAYAISLAEMMLKTGDADIVIVGGADSHIDEEYILGFNQILAMSANNDEYETASRPFSKDRDGFVIGEGAGVLILEKEEIARERKAKIYAELVGCAITSEATHIVAPKKDGTGMVKTMRLALKKANIQPEEVDYINAHGTGTYLNDKYETEAIKACFGERAHEISISSSKSMIGHTLGAAGALEAIITVLSIYNGIITPTINYKEPDPELDLDYTPNEARKRNINVAITNSFGFGGHNATLVFKKYDDKLGK